MKPDQTNFVPRDALIATGVFARAKARVRIKLPMYVDRIPSGLLARFEGQVGGQEFSFAALATKAELRDAKSIAWRIESSMARGWREFLAKLDAYQVMSWLQWPM